MRVNILAFMTKTFCLLFKTFTTTKWIFFLFCFYIDSIFIISINRMWMRISYRNLYFIYFFSKYNSYVEQIFYFIHKHNIHIFHSINLTDCRLNLHLDHNIEKKKKTQSKSYGSVFNSRNERKIEFTSKQ